LKTSIWRILCAHIYEDNAHILSGTYAFRNFTHAGYIKCMFGNLQVAK
jgi:hypothetical protein